MATAVTEIELAGGLSDLAGFSDYERAFVLLRMHGHVVGTLRIPVRLGAVCASDVQAAIATDRGLGERLIKTAVMSWLFPNGRRPAAGPTWTVVICTRNRTELLRRCLDSLVASHVTDGEVIVVDNGPTDSSTAELCALYPVRYLHSDRAGLNHARSLGAREASGEVVIFIDDDVIVEERWLPALIAEFQDPRVAAVTGPGMPLELETEAQELFELYGGFWRGFERKEFDFRTLPPAAAGRVGSGLNMAIRRDSILALRLFEHELDLGTASITGGDSYAFYRLLSEGHRIVYTPDAVVRHVHRREREALHAQIYGYGVGVYAFLTKCLVEHRDPQAARVGLDYFQYLLRHVARSILRRPDRIPVRHRLADVRGALMGPAAYVRSRRAAKARGETPASSHLEGKDDLARV